MRFSEANRSKSVVVSGKGRTDTVKTADEWF